MIKEYFWLLLSVSGSLFAVDRPIASGLHRGDIAQYYIVNQQQNGAELSIMHERSQLLRPDRVRITVTPSRVSEEDLLQPGCNGCIARALYCYDTEDVREKCCLLCMFGCGLGFIIVQLFA
jgi:hypothetical protein